MKVMKFGGTSVGTPENIKKVRAIVSKSYQTKARLVVVVSAFTRVTDQMIELGDLASQGKNAYKKSLLELFLRHNDAAKQLIKDHKHSREVFHQINQVFKELENALEGIRLLKELSPKIMDFIMSFGERLSGYIISESFAQYGIPSKFVDTRELLVTNRNFGNAKVDFTRTNKNIQKYFHKFFKKSTPPVPIITGFIGATVEGETTTLGRGGSDYTASIVAAAIDANRCEIWTDVDGVMSADPRRVKNAFTIKKMSYWEAMEMSHFGAKVIYPPTMLPVMEKNIPIVIKNTFNSEFSGTIIHKKSINHYPIKGISSISNITIVLLQGGGMIGVPGIAARLFQALAQNQINVIMITQASSEHSICLALLPRDAILAKEAIEEEFAREIKDKIIDPPSLENNRSVIAIVGEHMRSTPGIAAKLFGALGQNKINVVAIAQGSSELNISVVIDNRDEVRALNVVHNEFFETQ